MKKNIILTVFTLLLFMIFTGCPTAVVQQPKFSSSSSGTTSSDYPENFTVSNGLKGKIDFSWSLVKGAKKYYIYSSDDQFSGFTKCYETSQTSFSFKDMPAGVDKYY